MDQSCPGRGDPPIAGAGQSTSGCVACPAGIKCLKKGTRLKVKEVPVGCARWRVWLGAAPIPLRSHVRHWLGHRSL